MNVTGPVGKFTAEMWDSVEYIRQDIIGSKFIRGLTDGTLNTDIFANYIAQDIIYLRQDNEALLKLSERAPIDRYRLFFKKLAEDGIASEQAMHDEYVPLYNIRQGHFQTRAFSDYGNFILKQASESPFEVAVAALLPCFWLYAYTGFKIYSSGSPDNKFMSFIQAYVSPAFNQLVKEYVEITEEISLKVTTEKSEEMKKAFIKAAEFELLVFKEMVP